MLQHRRRPTPNHTNHPSVGFLTGRAEGKRAGTFTPPPPRPTPESRNVNQNPLQNGCPHPRLLNLHRVVAAEFRDIEPKIVQTFWIASEPNALVADKQIIRLYMITHRNQQKHDVHTTEENEGTYGIDLLVASSLQNDTPAMISPAPKSQ